MNEHRIYALLEYADVKHRNSTDAQWRQWIQRYVMPALRDYERRESSEAGKR